MIFEISRGDDLLLKLEKQGDQESWSLGEEKITPGLLSRIKDISAELKDLEVYSKRIVVISSERVNVITSGNWQIYFNPQENLDWQITKLKAVLEEYITPEERRQLEYIDLRFGNLAPLKKKEE